MKDAEFIELLNLYLDHEISAEDSARLEAEVQSNPARRRTYQEYCRMQKACLVLAQESAVTEEAAVDRKVVAFEPARSRAWGFGTYATGLCAAAACVALVFVARHRFEPAPASEASLNSNTVAIVQAPAAGLDSSTPRAIARTVSVPSRQQTDLKPAFVAYTSLSGKSSDSNQISGVQDARFEWLNNVQISSLSRTPTEDLVFRVKAGEALETRALSVRPVSHDRIETTAFQFQR